MGFLLFCRITIPGTGVTAAVIPSNGRSETQGLAGLGVSALFGSVLFLLGVQAPVLTSSSFTQLQVLPLLLQSH